MSERTRVTYEGSISDLVTAGLIAPGAKLERTYKGVKLTATINEAHGVVFKGLDYGSPSKAAAAARQFVLGSESPPATNGWSFWMLKLPKRDPVPLATLREQYIQCAGKDSAVA
ncbi:MAG: hypothetical protein PHR35_23235 [Kiritimatiellae bacterium]|nr:hypothetical protein [Kiritimatiellia bacterium]